MMRPTINEVSDCLRKKICCGAMEVNVGNFAVRSPLELHSLHIFETTTKSLGASGIAEPGFSGFPQPKHVEVFPGQN